MELLFSIVQFVTNIALIIGVIIALCQLKLSRKIAEKDFERRKKEATIDFANDIVSRTNELMVSINQVFGDDKIYISDVRYLNDTQMQGYINRYLNLMERMSVGINTEVYDFDIFRRICGTRTLRAWDRLKNVVYEKRKLYGEHA